MRRKLRQLWDDVTLTVLMVSLGVSLWLGLKIDQLSAFLVDDVWPAVKRGGIRAVWVIFILISPVTYGALILFYVLRSAGEALGECAASMPAEAREVWKHLRAGSWNRG